jgi:uncharacterized protein (TIGR03546 family)
MLSLLAKLLAALNANSRPGEIAAAAAFGLMLALIPGGNLLWFALLVIVFLLKVHLASALIVMAAGKLIAPLADPLLEQAGLFILNRPALAPFFTSMANAPLLPYTSFNHSLVMGGFAAGMLLWVPVFLLFIPLVNLYRNTLRPKLAESRLVKGFQRFPLVNKLFKATAKAGGLFRTGV